MKVLSMAFMILYIVSLVVSLMLYFLANCITLLFTVFISVFWCFDGLMNNDYMYLVPVFHKIISYIYLKFSRMFHMGVHLSWYCKNASASSRWGMNCKIGGCLIFFIDVYQYWYAFVMKGFKYLFFDIFGIMVNELNWNQYSVYKLTFHLVLVIKYCRKVINQDIFWFFEGHIFRYWQWVWCWCYRV